MAGGLRDQALSLLAAANNHGDLAVKLSSLKQAKDILLSADSSLTSELFPYLVELQFSPESLVRKALVETIEEIVLESMEYSSLLVPVLLILLNDHDSVVARLSVVAGANIFWSVLQELTSQFHRRGMVERWLEELWTLMIKFKEAVFRIPLMGGSIGPKILAVKFVEGFALLLTPANSERRSPEAVRTAWAFNASWLVAGHPILDSDALKSEANRAFDILVKLLRSAGNLPGVVLISVVNSLAAIARKRPTHYNSVLSVLLDFHLNFEAAKGVHTASVQYSLRTAFLGFLRCTYPPILESRDMLLRSLQGMNAGDAADQAIRQADKMLRSGERASRDPRLSKEEQTPNQVLLSGDQTKKRSTPMDLEEPMNNYDSKRIRYNPINHAPLPVQISDGGQENTVNGLSPKVPLLDGALTPVEQMIAMIAALVAEGERGAESLDILISKIHPDLLADIVITNMKHLPGNPSLLVNLGNLPVTKQSDPSSNPSQMLAPVTSTVSAYASVPAAQVPLPSNVPHSSLSDAVTTSSADTKRDPRRDLRRFDPRRIALPVEASSEHIVEGIATLSGHVDAEVDSSIPLNKPLSLPVVTSAVHVVPKTEGDLPSFESLVSSRADFFVKKEDGLDIEAKEVAADSGADVTLDVSLSPVHEAVQDSVEPGASDVVMPDRDYSFYLPETDQLSPAVDTFVSEEACLDLPVLPLYVELAEEQQRNIRKLAIERIIDSYKQLQASDNMQTRMTLLARLVAQTDVDDDAVVMIQKHIVSDYQHQKGHEHVMHVLYHLHSLMVTDTQDSSVVHVLYENFLLGVAKSLLDALPATDKSFSRLFGEAPFLPDSALKLLDDLCCSDNSNKDVSDGDRVTQGLGSLWSLILGRPQNRQACLDIALKCAVHTRDDIRAKAIRLVANKLYVISYISENVEDFASNMLLSAVDRHASVLEQRTGETGSQETSISGSQTEAGTSENDSSKGVHTDSQSDYSMPFSQVQRQISLYFALCIKKPSLLQLVFHHYGCAPKAVKQAIHRHIPVLMRALGSSYSELLRIISDPPQGSENLLTQVLHILSEGTTPSADLVATIKCLYETKLKDATILIPVLSSFTKNEVLPIFPRLVDLPLEKFQKALAHILQGSAHTGPALTPAEVLVAIHDIIPEKDGIALKKIMDACSACFEQRMVFTHQVLAKALNQMVEQTPLPLLLMRTVIQAIDAFPTLVDFVMEILSKLVSKQVWRLPKLWIGFLKCISQTQPHSFNVLLQLPALQLEGALNKYPKLRSGLAAYADQPTIKASLSRSTMVVLGLVNESHAQQAHLFSFVPQPR